LIQIHDSITRHEGMGEESGRSSLGETGIAEIAGLFLRLGLTAFGGPAAHLGLMEREAVAQRRWMSRESFLDLVGACNLLPGPSSTQVAMALGYTRHGWLGLLAAGVCFIGPAALATLGFAWAYVQYGSLPQAQGLLYGAKPAMVALIVQAVWKLGRTAFKSKWLGVAGAACFAAALLGAPPLAVLLASGGVVLVVTWGRRRRSNTAMGLVFLPVGVGTGAASAVGLMPLFLVFLKLGVVVFGSGYVLLAFIQADLVDRLHWVTQSQLLDAVTAGQVTPGPLFASATFLGYVIGGWSGAAVATAAIFLPSFLLAGVAAMLAERIRRSELAGAFLDGVNVAAVAVMASVALTLGRAALVDGLAWGVGVVSAGLLIWTKVNPAWLILGGAVVGLLAHGLK
jgi:chromate transporter